MQKTRWIIPSQNGDSQQQSERQTRPRNGKRGYIHETIRHGEPGRTGVGAVYGFLLRKTGLPRRWKGKWKQRRKKTGEPGAGVTKLGAERERGREDATQSSGAAGKHSWRRAALGRRAQKVKQRKSPKAQDGRKQAFSHYSAKLETFCDRKCSSEKDSPHAPSTVLEEEGNAPFEERQRHGKNRR